MSLLSVCQSFAHHTSGIIYHVIITFGTHEQMMISPGFFSFFLILIFRAVRGVKSQKMAQNDQKIMCISLRIPKFLYTYVKYTYEYFCLPVQNS